MRERERERKSRDEEKADKTSEPRREHRAEKKTEPRRQSREENRGRDDDRAEKKTARELIFHLTTHFLPCPDENKYESHMFL
jgi:hypothetical protein